MGQVVHIIGYFADFPDTRRQDGGVVALETLVSATSSPSQFA